MIPGPIPVAFLSGHQYSLNLCHPMIHDNCLSPIPEETPNPSHLWCCLRLHNDDIYFMKTLWLTLSKALEKSMITMSVCWPFSILSDPTTGSRNISLCGNQDDVLSWWQVGESCFCKSFILQTKKENSERRSWRQHLSSERPIPRLPSLNSPQGFVQLWWPKGYRPILLLL